MYNKSFGQKVKERLIAIGKAISLFVRTNYLMFGYILAVMLCELTGVAVTSGRFYISEPWIYFTFIAMVCLVSAYLPGHNKRFVLFVCALVVNFIIDMVFIILYDSTGTVFDYAMLNLRGDAMAILESIPLSFTYVFVSAIVITLYCVLGIKLKKFMPEPKPRQPYVIATTVSLILVIGTNGILVYSANYKYDSNDLSYKLYQNETSTYSNKGIIGNFYNELARGMWFSEINVGNKTELREFIYAKTTDTTEYTGIAQDYNVVTILCESFEWFTFLYDAERYPNGYAKLLQDDGMTEEQLSAALRELYPNLYRLYDSNSTVILDNSYSLEKTDTSENKSIIGNYPLYEYINYKYPNNSLPFSLPNMLKTLYGVESRSFHNGTKNFYNRNEHHTHALGFESFTSVEDMGISSDSAGVGERNLDSLMMEACKEEMFPTDRRFNTYITTITMHGQYAYRESLRPYYDKMDALGILPYERNDDDSQALRYYCAAGMDFDKAIGIMLDYLDEKGLSDKTLITLFGDHNCYYQGVSNYVKDIYSYSVDNYTELYRVPVIIKVGNNDLTNGAMSHGESAAYFIEKFTCVADIYPTILDLLGIKGFANLMYGTSAFSKNASILYSRAYDKFITDKIYFNTLSHIIYQAPDVDNEYIAEITDRALTLLNKISHINRIYAGDFLSGSENETYRRHLLEINGIVPPEQSEQQTNSVGG